MIALLKHRFLSKPLLLLFFHLAFLINAGAQNAISVTGTVKGARNEPLPAVTIQVKGTQQSTTSDDAGNFSITVPAQKSTLVFHSPGTQHRSTMQIPGLC